MMIVICVVIVLLAVADYVTTRKVLARGGIELNPVMKWCMDRKCFEVVKFGLTLFIVGFLLFEDDHPAITLITGLVIAAGYCWVVWHNWRQLR